MKIIGFGNHAPDEVLLLLKEKGVKRQNVSVINSKVKRIEQCQYVVALSLNVLRALPYKDNRHGNIVFIVVDEPLRLFKFGVPTVDCKLSSNVHLDGILLLTVNELPEPTEIEFDRLKPEYDIVEFATEIAKSQKTFLNQFMTFIYSMPSATHQKPIKELVCKWMETQKPLESLNKSLDAIQSTSPMSAKQRKRLNEILDNEVTELYRTALQQKGTEDEVAIAYSVSAYELRYIRAINNTLK